MNRRPGPTRVHAADYQIDVIGDPVTFGNVLGHGFPLQPPEQIESVNLSATDLNSPISLSENG